MAQPPVAKVYLLPMRGGFDQFLSSRLSEARLLTVVIDVKAADAVLTDRLGPAFDKSLAELFETPEEKKAKEEENQNGYAPGIFMSGSSKGNIFLVDLKSRQVLWSAYERPKNNTPDQLNRAAGQIVQRMQKDWAVPKN
jgi:hypothetical protein